MRTKKFFKQSIMSGGRYEYFQRRYEWDEAIDDIQNQIDENPNSFSDKTIGEFEMALVVIKTAKVCLHRIDWLLSGDDGEESFHERLREDLLNLHK